MSPPLVSRIGRTPQQYIQELRFMAQQMSDKRSSIDESFTLVSGQAAIHADDPVHQKMVYFDNLKQRDAQAKKMHQQLEKLKKHQTKDQL